MKVIGLTGGIATGKSAVSTLLREKTKFPVIDADQIARDIVAPGSPVLAQIAARFGQDILTADGAIDRAALGKKVFANPALLKTLNSLTHPAILAQIQKALTILEQQGYGLVFLEVPLLYETGMDKLCDAVILVTAHPHIQVERLKSRSGLSDEECRKRIASQWPTDKKSPLAQYLIDNSGHILQTETRLKEVIRELVRKFDL